MPFFEYKALASDGSISEGRLDALGRHEALNVLQGRGLRPIKLSEGAANARAPKTAAAERKPLWRNGEGKVSHRQLQNFMRQLSNLLAGGVPLSRALQLMSRESASTAAGRQWKAIHDRVIDGMPLADAMAQLPDTFPRVYIAMVRAGETGGFLDVVLNQIADFQGREKELRGKVKSALIYPAVLVVLTIGVLIFLMTFFIPRFQKLFEGLGGTLPLLTQIIIDISHFVTHYGLVVAAVIGVVIYGIRQWLQTGNGRRAWEQFILKLPLIGSLNARFAMTRFCRMLGTLMKSGVPLVNALRVARDSLGNQILVDAVGSSIERVQKGDSLARSMGDCPQLFPAAVVEMVAVAEESGRLDDELLRLADVTEHDLDAQLRTTVALAEPVMLFFMAGFIGCIFIGMVLPIFSIQDYIK
jgi:type II secretory pathway component PulF